MRTLTRSIPAALGLALLPLACLGPESADTLPPAVELGTGTGVTGSRPLHEGVEVTLECCAYSGGSYVPDPEAGGSSPSDGKRTAGRARQAQRPPAPAPPGPRPGHGSRPAFPGLPAPRPGRL